MQRLGFFLPQMEKVIWIHAVSVGEVKAAAPFFQLLKKQFPSHRFCITTTTATGFVEAKKINADQHLYLPLDFSFSANRFVQKINPECLFLIEGDLWPNLLKAMKKKGKVFLVSGKMSERSFKRFSLFPKLTSKLFSHLDLLCVQSEEHANRFAHFVPEKVKVTGNLKFDMAPVKTEMLPRDFLTIACTHRHEEELLLDRLHGIDLPIFLAPRHPERFSEVASLLLKKNISFAHFSEEKEAKVILVDRMGALPICYSQSKIAIIGGSFVPNIGGHNLLEPALYGCPTIFGPYTHKQIDLVNKILDAKAGRKATLENLVESIHQILEDLPNYIQRSSDLSTKLQGSSHATWCEVQKVLGDNSEVW